MASSNEEAVVNSSNTSVPERPTGFADAGSCSWLPKTCTIVEKNDLREVYVVGTAHFSRESQDDVSLVMKTIQPHVVLIELCRSRLGILQLDEQKLMEEVKDINFQKIRQSVQKNGVVSGILQILLLRMSAEITKQLGMAPGGEFRRAFQEAQRIPNCRVVYGDRPIAITLQRAIGSLSFLQKIQLAWHLLSSDIDLSPEDIEKCKEKDMLEQLMTEMAGTFPSLSRVFVEERDIFLAHSLKRSTCIDLGPSGQYSKPIKVVAILGIGHVNGVVKFWNEDLESRAKQLCAIPPPTIAGKLTAVTLKLGLLIGAGFLVYKTGRLIWCGVLKKG